METNQLLIEIKEYLKEKHQLFFDSYEFYFDKGAFSFYKKNEGIGKEWKVLKNKITKDNFKEEIDEIALRVSYHNKQK